MDHMVQTLYQQISSTFRKDKLNASNAYKNGQNLMIEVV